MEPLPGHEPEQATMKEFWMRDERNRAEARPAMEVMSALHKKLASVGRVVWVARPGSGSTTTPTRSSSESLGSRRTSPRVQGRVRDIYQAQFGRKVEDLGLQMTHDARYQAKLYEALAAHKYTGPQ